jgi:hypothetical protein
MKRVAIVFALMSTLAGPAFAQQWNPMYSNHWNINSIQQHLQNRIRMGAANGSLDRREVAKLQDQYNRINDLERRLRQDGLTYDERMRLDQELDKLSADIYRESRDGNFLGNSPWGWINTPAFRPRGWDERRWCSTNWDNRWHNSDQWNNNWRNDNQWANNRGNDNWWNNNQWANNRGNDNWWNNNQWANNRGNDNRGNNNGSTNNGIDQMQRSLATRIRSGRKDGSLSADEATQLRDKFRNIERQEDRFRSGGFNANERQQLSNSMNRLSREIRRERHD